ncbi:unnamed protein product [Caretta caretta]
MGAVRPLPQMRDTCAVCRVQTGERPYQGAACGKRFSHSSTLAALRRIHTGERPYCCGQGRESFTYSSVLAKHQSAHAGLPPFPCAWCSKSFASCPVLATHQRVRTGECPFHCTDCGKSFWGSSSLAEHRRLHTGERPFCCPQCPKAYTSSSILAKHLRSTHAGPGPCPQCGEACTSLAVRTRHPTAQRHPTAALTVATSCAPAWHWLSTGMATLGCCPTNVGACGKAFSRSMGLVEPSAPTDSALAQSCAPACSPTPGTSPTFVVPAGGPLPAVPTWLGAGTPASGPAAALTMARASTTAWC